MKKTTQLKNMINSHNLELLMEAHNGLSAKIVEESGFKGIWASGLGISAAMGVRDNFVSDSENYTTVLFGGSGTAAVEAILSSVVGQDAVVIINNGAYGKRMCQIPLNTTLTKCTVIFTVRELLFIQEKLITLILLELLISVR